MIRIDLKPRPEWGTPDLAAAIRAYWTMQRVEEFRKRLADRFPDPSEWRLKRLEEPRHPLAGSLAKGGDGR